MTKEEALAALTEYLRNPGDTNHPPPPAWSGQSPLAEAVGEDTWVFRYSTAAEPGGVVISTQHEPTHFCGALGKAVPCLGLPRTRERFLGSSVYGRYLVYRDGIAVWEAEPDIGFPVPTLPNEAQEGRQCRAIVGFFDLRGFTSWSSRPERTPTEIQGIVQILEEEFQAAFSKGWCHRLFTKGTGDGFMVVSEAGSCHGLADGKGGFQSGHAALFVKACSTLIVRSRPRLPEELAIGCGITIGAITRIFLLGRPDYISSLVNEAAKIQQIAWDELCVTQEFLKAMRDDGMKVSPHRLGDKGWRVSPPDCIAAAEALTNPGPA